MENLITKIMESSLLTSGFIIILAGIWDLLHWKNISHDPYEFGVTNYTIKRSVRKVTNIMANISLYFLLFSLLSAILLILVLIWS